MKLKKPKKLVAYRKLGGTKASQSCEAFGIVSCGELDPIAFELEYEAKEYIKESKATQKHFLGRVDRRITFKVVRVKITEI
jgi:hypothetical protein